MRIRLLVVCIALLGAAVPAAAQSPENYHLELGLMFWKPTPEVFIASGTLATTIDFINQFGVEKDRFKEFRAVLKASQHHKVRYSTVPLEYEGNAILNQTITFRGQTYNVGVPTSGQLKWTLQRIGYEWDPIATNRGFIGVFTDIKYNKLHAELSAPAPVGTQTFSRDVAIPTLGGSGRAYLSRLVSVSAEFTALKLNHNTFNTKFYDFDLYGTLNLGPYAGAQLGYRRVTADYVIDDDAGELKMKGPYFGGVVRF